jgi:hypothetical protein
MSSDLAVKIAKLEEQGHELEVQKIGKANQVRPSAILLFSVPPNDCALLARLSCFSVVFSF